jgi:hypothetical protein
MLPLLLPPMVILLQPNATPIERPMRLDRTPDSERWYEHQNQKCGPCSTITNLRPRPDLHLPGLPRKLAYLGPSGRHRS